MSFTVRFFSGTYWHYQFDSNGNVTAANTYVLPSNSSAHADLRKAIPNRTGMWLHMVDGVFAGNWIHESADACAFSESRIPDVVFTSPPPPPPPTGKPWDQYGATFKKDFSDGTLAPFKVLDYPDDHIGGSGQFMTVFNRFRHAATHTLVHDGYLEMWAKRQGSGNLWDSDLIGTSQANNGPTFGLGITRYWARFNPGPGTWQCCWLYDTTSWSADEIDWPEMLENMSPTAHVIGTGAGAKYGIPLPADIATNFHEFSVERRASFIAFGIDGKEVARFTKPQSLRKLAILLDAKVGFGWTGSTGQITSNTPNPTFLHIAAVTVDP